MAGEPEIESVRGVCAWCKRDAFSPNIVRWRGSPYHQKCAMVLANKVKGDGSSLETTE